MYPRIKAAPGLASVPASGLFHALLDVEPAVVANQPLRFYLLAANLELALVRTPFGFHFLQSFNRQMHPRRLCRRRSRGLGGSRVEAARDKQHGGKTNTGAKHRNPPGLISLI